MNPYSVVLVNPEIPPNTGNIMRLCANTNCGMHIIKPLGFELDHKSVKRAGMDYLKNIRVTSYENIYEFKKKNNFKRFFLVSKYGKKNYAEITYKPGDYFIFGSESKGLSRSTLELFKDCEKIFIPMANDSRSINLSNSVAIVIFEAYRQNNFQFL